MQTTEIQNDYALARDVSSVKLDASSLAGDFSLFQHSKFKSIEVYGTVHTPLFTVSSVEKMLQITLQLRHNTAYVAGKHYASIRIVTRGGWQEKQALTEQGLYKCMHTTVNTISQEFDDFVFALLRSLRSHDDAHAVRAANRAASTMRADHLLQIKQAHDERDMITRRLDKQSTKLSTLHDKNIVLTSKLRDAGAKNKKNIGARLEKMEQRVKQLLKTYGNTVYVYTVRTPAAFASYNAYPDYDYCDTHQNPADTLFVGVFDREQSRGCLLGEIHVEKPMRATQLRERFRSLVHINVPETTDRDFMLGTANTFDAHDNCFHASLDTLELEAQVGFDFDTDYTGDTDDTYSADHATENTHLLC